MAHRSSRLTRGSQESALLGSCVCRALLILVLGVTAALRAVSQRDGDARTPYARIQNLGRVRVLVK